MLGYTPNRLIVLFVTLFGILKNFRNKNRKCLIFIAENYFNLFQNFRVLCFDVPDP